MFHEILMKCLLSKGVKELKAFFSTVKKEMMRKRGWLVLRICLATVCTFLFAERAISCFHKFNAGELGSRIVSLTSREAADFTPTLTIAPIEFKVKAKGIFCLALTKVFRKMCTNRKVSTVGKSWQDSEEPSKENTTDPP